VPFRENADGTVTLFRTRITKSALMFDNVFPLRKEVRDQEAIGKIESDLRWQIIGETSEEALNTVFTEDWADKVEPLHRWEIEKIVGHTGDGTDRQYTGQVMNLTKHKLRTG
jgi:hypothetical protein